MKEDIIIEPISIRDQVANLIRRKILTNEFVGKTKISEREISEMLNISTTPVKEAFRMLESEGILVTVPRKGTFISQFSKESLRSITIIRSSLEGTAAFFAASFINRDEVAIMEKALEKAKQCIENDQKEQLYKNNTLFHKTIRIAARNEYLLNLLNTLKSIDDSVRIVSVEKSREVRLRDYKEHCNILQDIKNGQGKKAENDMVEHVRRVIDMTLYER